MNTSSKMYTDKNKKDQWNKPIDKINNQNSVNGNVPGENWFETFYFWSWNYNFCFKIILIGKTEKCNFSLFYKHKFKNKSELGILKELLLTFP